MKGLRRIALFCLVVIVLLSASIVVLLRLLPESDFVKKELESRVEESTGLDVVLGQVGIGIAFPGIVTLDIRDISLKSGDGEPLLRAERVVLEPSIYSLLRRELSIRSVTLKRLRILVSRRADGTLEGFFMPVPSQGGMPPTAGDIGRQTPAPDPGKNGRDQRRTEGTEYAPLKWSVDVVRLEDARIDFRDLTVSPEGEFLISLKDLNGQLEQSTPGKSFKFSVKSKLGRGEMTEGEIKAAGIAELNSDMSQLEKVQLNIAGGSLGFHLLEPYLGGWGQMAAHLHADVVNGSLAWEKGKPSRAEVKTRLKTELPETGEAQFSGEFLFASNLLALEEVRLKGETDGFPLKFFSGSIPVFLPIDPSKGIIKAEVSGNWNSGCPWSMQGTIGLENAVATGGLAALAPTFRVWLQAKVAEDAVALETLEISASRRLLGLSGNISQPFSGAPTVDLRADGLLDVEQIRKLAPQLPEALRLVGSVPFKGSIKGKASELLINASGELTSTHIAWSRFLEKKQGHQGGVSVKGTYSLGRGAAGRVSENTFAVESNLSGVVLSMTRGGKVISDVNLRMRGRLTPGPHAVDVKDVQLSLRKGADALEILNIRGGISGLGSRLVRVDSDAVLNFDASLLPQLGMVMPQNMAVTGKSVVNMKLGGTLEAIDWAVQAPLTQLDVTIENFLKKPGGTKGNLSVAGKWAGGELSITKGSVVLPGLDLSMYGNMLDKSGNFRAMTFDVRKAELGDLSRITPGISTMGLSGTLEARIRLTQTGKGLSHTGTVRLLDVNYRPQNSHWTLHHIKGAVDLEGTSVQFPDIEGQLKGIVDAPIRAKGKLAEITSVGMLKGNVSLNMGHGTVKADPLSPLLGQAQALVGPLMDQGAPKLEGLLEIQSGSASFQIESGTMRTDDFIFRGPAVKVASIGSIQLPTNQVDAVTCMETVTTVGNALQKLPAVQKLVKQHEGLLKITGLDKELKRYGIQVPRSDEQKQGETEPVKTPVTLILRIKGPTGNPRVVPVLESSLDRKVVSQLKSLMN